MNYYNENDPFTAQWLKELIKAKHISNGVVDTRSITEVLPGDLSGYKQCHFFAGIGVWSYALRQSGFSDDRKIWTGSCPCQPFSAAGKRKGTEDERHLWPVWFELIRACKPELVVGEQVASKDALAWIDTVQTDMEKQDYAFGAVDTCAAGFGAPHIRQRLYWLAHAAWATRIGTIGRDNSGIDPRRGREIDGLADAESPARGLSIHGTRSRDWVEPVGGSAVGESRGFGGGSEDGAIRLADSRQEQWRASMERRPDNTSSFERNEESIHDQQRGEHGGVGYPELHGLSPEQQSGGTAEKGWLFKPEGSGTADGRIGLVNTDNSGSQGRCLPERERSRERTAWRPSSPSRPNPTNGFWRDVDWLWCRDSKWRPVEPGTSPLANGAPARVGRLRGFGNAIVAPQATEFLKAVQEIIG